jgi:hypothetical protein
MTTYNCDDIFEDIPGDPDNVLMKIPDEILAETGWAVGDTLSISVVDGSIYISKKSNG